jgi:hypothetical protein
MGLAVSFSIEKLTRPIARASFLGKMLNVMIRTRGVRRRVGPGSTLGATKRWRRYSGYASGPCCRHGGGVALYSATATVGNFLRRKGGAGSTGGSTVAAPAAHRAAMNVACGSVVRYCDGIKATTRRFSMPTS